MERTLDAFLLTRSWYDRQDGLRFVFWCASDDGPVRLVFDRQEAVMFVERSVPNASGRRKELALTSLRGKAVDGLYFPRQRDLYRERDAIRAAMHRTFEGDVKAHDRFLMERFITGGLTIRGRAQERNGYLEFASPQIKAKDYAPKLSVVAFDIETDGFDGDLLSISCAGAGGDRVWMKGDDPAAFDGPATFDDLAFEDIPLDDTAPDYLRYAPGERQLLEAFIAHIRAVDPDVLTGWNVVDFDLTTLQRKCEEHNVAFAIGRDSEPAKVLQPRSAQQPAIARVSGRVVLDGIATLRAATFSFESFRLQDVAEALLSRGKKIDHSANPVEEIRRLYAEDKPALAAYNLEDSRLVLDIFKSADLLGFAQQRQALTGLPMGRQGGSVAAFDNLYLPRLHRHGHVAPDVGDSREVVTSPGGYVLDSVPGLYENVLVLDFKSLYPSIIRTFAIDPMGLAFPGASPVPGFEGARFARERHLLPEIITGLWAARDEAKARDDAARSRAIKILMNSFYGVLGTPGCRFFSPKLASSITLRGHEIITESRAFIEARGLRVIYGDTDSLFVLVGRNGEDESLRIGEETARDLNLYWRDRLREEHDLESGLEVEFETHYLRFLMPTMRGSNKGSKKRYAGLVRDAKGGTRVIVKGLEAARTDWTPLARRVQRELFRRIFEGEEYEGWLLNIARQTRAGAYDDELVYRKRLRRALDDYERNVPPHVQAARKLGRPAREIRYLMTSAGPEPVDLPHATPDYDHYLDKQLAPASDAILPFLGTDFATIAGPQLVLFGR